MYDGLVTLFMLILALLLTLTVVLYKLPAYDVPYYTGMLTMM
jgi:hypothetical protein